MLIRVASDLHLEAFSFMALPLVVEKFLPIDERDAESVLVLAGDICSQPDFLLDFLEAVETRFKKVIYVPGNHEPYKHDFHELNGIFQSWDQVLKNTLHPFHDGTDGYAKFEVDDVEFLITTMWADGGKTAEEKFKVGRCLNDFKLIKVGEELFSVQFMEELHTKYRALLLKDLSTPSDLKRVVVTHHMPSTYLCHPRFGNEINGGFASDLDDMFMADIKPDLWIFGHTHDTIDKMFQGVHVVCNPAGYRGEWNTEFNQYHSGPKFVEV